MKSSMVSNEAFEKCFSKVSERFGIMFKFLSLILDA